jgi:hypothetical protein
MPEAIRAARASNSGVGKYRAPAQSVADGEFMREFMKVVCCVIRLVASVMMELARPQSTRPWIDRRWRRFIPDQVEKVNKIRRIASTPVPGAAPNYFASCENKPPMTKVSLMGRMV